jgi:hypothetical protein
MGAPHVLSAHAVSAAVSRSRCRVMTKEWPATSTCGGADVVAAHETPGPNAGSPMRSGLRLVDAGGGVTSRRVDAVYPSRDEASVGTGGMSRTTRSDGRLDDSAIPTSVRRAPTECAGHSSSALQRLSIVVSGWGCTAAGRRRAASHCGRASASSEPLRPGVGEQRATAAGRRRAAAPPRPSVGEQPLREPGRALFAGQVETVDVLVNQLVDADLDDVALGEL